MRKLLVVALAFVLTITVAATPTYGASGPRLAQASSEPLTAEEAGRFAGNYLGLLWLWSELAADDYWHEDGSTQTQIDLMTRGASQQDGQQAGLLKQGVVDVLVNYFDGHLKTPPEISGKEAYEASRGSGSAAFTIVGFEKTPRTRFTVAKIYDSRGSIYGFLNNPRPDIRYENWDTFYKTLVETTTTEWARKGTFVDRVERLRDLYTAISEVWPDSTDRSLLEDPFNGTDSAPGLDHDIKLNIDGPARRSDGLTATQAGLLVGQYINLQSYWKELIDTTGWGSSWSDTAKVDTASAGVEKHIEDVITDYFERNITAIQDSVEVGAAPDARSAAQDTLAITDPDPDPDGDNIVRNNIYVKLGSPWPKSRYDAWNSFYKGLSDAAKDEVSYSLLSQKMGRLLGLYTKLYNATPSQDRSGLNKMFNALTADIGKHMTRNHRTMLGKLPSGFTNAQLTGCLDCPLPVMPVTSRLYLFVLGASLQELQEAFGTDTGSNPRLFFRHWYVFYDAFKEAAG